MIRPGIVWGVARAEARLCRRLVRYWVFQIVAAVVGLYFFSIYHFMHYQFSAWSGTVSLINPRFLISAVGLWYLMGFLLGLVFMGFDVRARDTRERMVEVLDAAPCSNLELLAGRFLGILIPSWIPVAVIALLFYAISAILGQPLEVNSMFAFIFLMAIPAYCFVLGLTFLLTIVIRHRLITAVVMVGILIGIIVVNVNYAPITLLPAVDVTGVFNLPWASDMMPRMVDARSGLQRSAFLLAGLGLLCFAAAIHPRRDDSSRSATAGLGALVIFVSAMVCGYLVWESKAMQAQKADWLAAHTARSEEPVLDVLALAGTVKVQPGRDLEMELNLRVRAPSDAPLSTALFSLNPGLEVRSARSSGGAELAVAHENGLLDLDLPGGLQPGEEMSIDLAIAGEPNMWFSYLESPMDPMDISIRDGNVFMLGFFPYMYERKFVALMPGVRWLPAPGSETRRGDPKSRPPDFYDLDLTVEIPDGWLVAGPGRRQPVEGNRFHFAPAAPVPHVALVAGPYESHAEEIEGVLVEALVHPKHAESVEFFADAANEIRDWVALRLREADELGLGYPYDGLTLAEVPGGLRGYGGGWRQDSTFIQPAMILVRESGFPTANFAAKFKDTSRYEEQEGGVPRAKRRQLERFFENDFTGGNPFTAAARSFFGHVTSGEGDEGLPMNFVCENLTTELVMEKTGYFSVHLLGADMQQAIQRTLPAIFRSQGEDMAGAIIHTLTSRNEVWDQVLGVSLADLDPWEEPEKTVDVLTLKGGAMARSMLDDLGREKTGRLLAKLRETESGGTFGREEILGKGEEIGEDLEPWLDVWLQGVDLPGFLLGEVEYHRITDSEDGSPNYQILVTVRNDESTPGLVRLEYRAGGPRGKGAPRGPGRPGSGGESDPVRIEADEAVQIGLVTNSPPRVVRVVPYLALNRDPFNVTLPVLDEEEIVDAEPFTGVRSVEWAPLEDEMIVVDDLDEGFSVEESGKRSMLRLGAQSRDDEDTDQGLPVAPFGPRQASRWSRWIFGNAYGKYRHTSAVVRPGRGERLAVFQAEIPSAGEWELEYYLPARRGGRGKGPRRSDPGTWNLTVSGATETRELTFDASGAESGWNSLGEFAITEGEVRVTVSDKTDGDFVIADAIRWVPVRKSGS